MNTVFSQVQFVMVMLHAFQLLFKNDCNYPVGFSYFIGAHAVMFYFLFSGFYKSTYMKKGKEAHKKVKVDDDQAKQQNGSATKLYEKVQSPVVEDSYSTMTLRQRVFVGANNWICQPVHIN